MVSKKLIPAIDSLAVDLSVPFGPQYVIRLTLNAELSEIMVNTLVPVEISKDIYKFDARFKNQSANTAKPANKLEAAKAKAIKVAEIRLLKQADEELWCDSFRSVDTCPLHLDTQDPTHAALLDLSSCMGLPSSNPLSQNFAIWSRCMGDF